MADAQAELGPSLPPRGAVYAQAVELLALARLAVEHSLAGHRCDLPRALDKLDQMRAILGGGDA